MVLLYNEQNAEKRRRGDAETRRRGDPGKIDESLVANKLSSSIIDAAIEVHTTLGGPGLLVSTKLL